MRSEFSVTLIKINGRASDKTGLRRNLRKTNDERGQIGLNIVINGIYEHYKGKRYLVVGVAKHSETLEDMVVYRQMYGEEGLWVRPLAMFLEDVQVDGKTLKRFQYIEK